MRLLDHLVGAGKQHWRHCQAKSLGRLHVDHQFELGRYFNGQIGRTGAAQNAVHKTRQRPVKFADIWPIGRQQSIACERGSTRHRWELGLHRELGHTTVDLEHRGIGKHHEGVAARIGD